MPTRSGRHYAPQVMPVANTSRRRRSVYPPGGFWGYDDNDVSHRHRPNDDEDKTEKVKSYRRRPAP